MKPVKSSGGTQLDTAGEALDMPASSSSRLVQQSFFFSMFITLTARREFASDVNTDPRKLASSSDAEGTDASIQLHCGVARKNRANRLVR